MIKFDCRSVGGSWELRRDLKLVCYFTSQDAIEAAASGYAESLCAHGKSARIVVWSGKERLSDRVFEPPLCQAVEDRLIA